MKWRYIPRFLYTLLFLFSITLFFFGRDYYLAPAFKKARHPLHHLLRQSGSAGHLFGIIGTLFMLLLLLYSVRKRFRFARKWGNLNIWLNVHIFLGFAGPVLVVFHTVFKYNGIVAITFWSMLLVVASGIVGKYIFALIPHSISGMELNRIEMEAEEIGLTFEMRKLIPAAHPLWQKLAAIESRDHPSSLLEPLRLLFEPFKLRKQLRRVLHGFSASERRTQKKLLALVVNRHMIRRKAKLLQQTMKVLHYWHLVHQPFVIIMFLILLLHIYIAAQMGYTWNF
jgi:hypothetical protein